MTKKKKKRIFSIINPVSDYTRSKRRKLHSGLQTTSKCWVSPSHLYNFMNDDPLLDYFNFLKRRPNRFHSENQSRPVFNNNSFKRFLMDQGNLHEKHVMDLIKEKGLPIVHISDVYSEEGVALTRFHLMKGTPILYSAPLCNEKSHTYGIADLIVRSDYLNKIVDVPLPDNLIKNGSSLSKKYYYIIIDIKFSKLNFRCDEMHLCNSGSFGFYKGQVLMYSDALNRIQGNSSPNIALILGRNCKINNGNNFTLENSNSSSPLNRYGLINFKTVDKHIIEKVRRGIQWRRDLKSFGSTWTLTPPSRDELYPNMCKKNDSEWYSQKKSIATQLGELTNLWMVGKRHRELAFSKGISSIYDTRLNALTLGIVNPKFSTIINKMIYMNRSGSSEAVIWPSKITFNDYDWRNLTNNLYIDFETFSDVFFDDSITPQIFQIGIGYIDNNVWKYKYFICKTPTLEEELRIVLEFTDFIANSFIDSKIYYWHAEKIFWRALIKRQRSRGCVSSVIIAELETWLQTNDLYDLRNFFIKNGIVIKGCFSYGLKELFQAMINNKLLQTNRESDCTNGQLAMIRAYDCYKNLKRPLESAVMKDIIDYNERDCLMLKDFLEYFVNNH